MSRIHAAAIACALLLPPAASAADPDSGTISLGNREISYTVPPAPLPNASGLVESYYACDDTNPCDEFMLTVDLPPGFASDHPDAYILAAAATDVEYLDIDIQLADADGNVLYNYRDNPPEQPFLAIYPEGGVQKFIIQVIPGTPHSGASATITLVGADPASKAGYLAGALEGRDLAVLLLSALLLSLCRRGQVVA